MKPFTFEEIHSGPAYGWLEHKNDPYLIPVKGQGACLEQDALIFDPYMQNAKLKDFYTKEEYGVTVRLWREFPSEKDRLDNPWAEPERTYSEREVNLLLECMYDSAFNAASLMFSGKLDHEDSREVMTVLRDVCWEYELKHDFHNNPDEDEGDYFEEIDIASMKKLHELCGKENPQ